MSTGWYDTPDEYRWGSLSDDELLPIVKVEQGHYKVGDNVSITLSYGEWTLKERYERFDGSFYWKVIKLRRTDGYWECNYNNKGPNWYPTDCGREIESCFQDWLLERVTG